jgi:chemotaxis protein CheC
MILSDKQRDALTELSNIAFARTASSLSELSGDRVNLDVPEIQMCPIDQLPNTISSLVREEIATVHQIFSGPVAGDALLLLNYSGAVSLTDLLSEASERTGTLDESAREAITEIGNILLNACLGVFGNLLKVQVSFSMPRLHLESLDQLLRSITIGSEELRYAVVVSTAFHVKKSAISGYLIIVLGVSSLDRLINAVEEWEDSQIGGRQ